MRSLPLGPETGEGRSLRARVLASCSRIVGAPERRQMMSLLQGADGYRLDPRAVASLADLLAGAPQNIERNIDLIRLPEQGIWVEFADADRRPAGVDPLPGARHPVDVGVLVCPDPGEDDKVVMMSAWDFEEEGGPAARASVRHSYAVVAFSRQDVSYHAFAARNHFRGQEDASLERILEQMNAYLPAGLGDELLLMAEVEEGDAAARASVEDQALRDAVGEAPFALAALLLLSSSGMVAGKPDGEGIRAVTVRRAPWTGVAASLLGSGFLRRGKPQAPRLGYRPA